MAQVMTCYRHPDRETGLSCSECGRPICTDCMTVAPVGLRCPDHSGARQAPRLPRAVRQAGLAQTPALMTRILIAVNVAIYLLELAGGAGINSDSGWIFEHGALAGPYVADGDWWRLITAAFLHYGPLHLAMNMLVLWFVGGPIEEVIGRTRYLLVYLVSGLAGSAGALLVDPRSITVGASGAVFGLFGALLVLEYEHTGRVVGGPAFTLILINLALSFLPGVSWGGHVGGLFGGILAMLALSRLGRGRRLSSSAGVAGVAGAIAVAALAVAVSYWKVRGYA